MIEVYHVGYQMDKLQILSRSMYNSNSFGLKNFSTRLSYSNHQEALQGVSAFRLIFILKMLKLYFSEGILIKQF